MQAHTEACAKTRLPRPDMFRRFFRRKRQGQTREVSPVQHEPELYDSDAADESYFGQVSTFATVEVGRRNVNDQKVVRVMPYFGPFAGRNVVFLVEESKTRVFVNNKKITTQFDRTIRGGSSVRDKCINFLHMRGSHEEWHFSYNIPPPQPHSLAFLCKRHILLSGVLPPGMPMREAAKFDHTTKQTVIVNVWPSSFVRRGETAEGLKDGLKIRVPARLSFGELSYFLQEKLGLPSTYVLHLHEPNGIYPLESRRPLMLQHTVLECFVRPQQLSCPTSPLQSQITVMMVGCGVGEVEVSPSTTVAELESTIADLFGLHGDDFVFIPSLFSSQVEGRMFTTANRQVALKLLDRKARRFPIVSENLPNLRVDHQELPLYGLTLAEAGLHVQNFTPLMCFNVTGPTVPLYFRAYSVLPGVGGGGASGGSSGSSGSGGNGSSNFIDQTFDTRIVSINPHWTASTLLKYVDFLTRTANTKLLCRDVIVSHDQVIGKLFDREWIVPNPNGRWTISPNVLKVL